MYVFVYTGAARDDEGDERRAGEDQGARHLAGLVAGRGKTWGTALKFAAVIMTSIMITIIAS